jgi:hypothetical protein
MEKINDEELSPSLDAVDIWWAAKEYLRENFEGIAAKKYL